MRTPHTHTHWHSIRNAILAGFASLVVIVGALIAMGGSDDIAATEPDDHAMRAAAIGFLDSLSVELRDEVMFEFDHDARMDWHYIPRRGHGISINQMSDSQRAAAHKLLRAGLSSNGYLKVSGVMQLESILREYESRGGRDASGRDPGRYRVAIFGDPVEGHPWGWRIEGHHVSITCSSITSSAIVATPAFLGANPAEVRDGPYAGWRLLAAEADLGFTLVGSLTEAQSNIACVGGAVPRDIIMRPGNDDAPNQRGLAASEMSDEQRATLRQLIVEYVRIFRNDLAHASLDRYLSPAQFDATTFAWVGDTTDITRHHYYRIQGPAIVIEYDNVGDGNHVHTVIRDLEHDFGLNLLREHYETQHDGGG